MSPLLNHCLPEHKGMLYFVSQDLNPVNPVTSIGTKLNLQIAMLPHAKYIFPISAYFNLNNKVLETIDLWALIYTNLNLHITKNSSCNF